MTEDERRREFYKRMAKGDHYGALDAIGYRVSPSVPVTTDTYNPPATPTRLDMALSQRERICGLIDRGLAHHPRRLDPGDWTQVKADLRMIPPNTSWLPAHLQHVIEMTRRVAIERGEQFEVWDRMEWGAFHTWVAEVIEALERYRQQCQPSP